MDFHRDINLGGIGLVMRRGCRDDWFYAGWKVGSVVLVILVFATDVVGGWTRTKFWMKRRWISGKLCKWKCGDCGGAGFESTDGYCDHGVGISW